MSIFDIAHSFALEYQSAAVSPAHLFKAVLHKEAGLIHFIETELSQDYYYLQEWADVQMQLAPKTAKPKSELDLDSEGQAVMDEAENYRLKFGLDDVQPVCILAALVTPGVGFSFDQLKTMPLTANDICGKMGTSDFAATPAAEAKQMTGGATGEMLKKYCTDKLAEAKAGKLTAVVGFDAEIENIFEILGRMTKSSLIITGDAGVGKSALLRGLTLRVAEGKVPAFLEGCSIFELDLAAIGADAAYKGEIDDRFKKLLAEVHAKENTIIIIESIDKVFDKQGALYGGATMIKQALSKGGLKLICSASIDGYTKAIETDKEFNNRLEKITVEEPLPEQTLEIMKGVIDEYEEFHKMKAPEDVLIEGIRLAKRYMTEKCLPDSAFDLVDRAMAYVKTQAKPAAEAEDAEAKAEETVVSEADLYAVVAKKTGIPMGKVQSSERDRLMNAEDTLKDRVVGQDHAVKKVLDAIFESRSGLNKKGQPMGSFFFLGPTGTGKTELSKALAEFLFQDESALIRFDMSEFKEEHSVALLYGAPPGYVGYEEGGLLVNKIRQNPYAVVLFDEIEKAHKSVFDLFLQILDEGKLHDRLGRVGDFSNALILFTSNIGSKFVVDKFNSGCVPENNDLMDIMQDYFRPEFLGRLTEIVPFSPITEDIVTRIFDIHLKGLLKLLKEQNIELTMSDEARRFIALKGYNQQYGARPVIGVIRKMLRNPLSKKIIAGEIKGGDKVTVELNGEEIVFKV
ncbi:MAG: ATP-dependent Clp protease ATP-binding subunit [Bacteroidaceae bacterium]|nr:ATP-dependent Clp protease ATP-binding subunit [Bacteroidaceae bacterium]